jgi:hypothetical protein
VPQAVKWFVESRPGSRGTKPIRARCLAVRTAGEQADSFALQEKAMTFNKIFYARVEAGGLRPARVRI